MIFKIEKFFVYLALICVIINYKSLAAQDLDMSPTRLTPQLNASSPENKMPTDEVVLPIIIPPSSKKRTPINIDETELEKIDSDSVGSLMLADGGFGVNMWEGSDKSRIEKLLPRIPINSLSSEIRTLTRRLLLSAATPPMNNNETLLSTKKEEFSSESNIIAKTGGTLLEMRIERLWAMGDVIGVESLLKVAPNRNINPILLKNQTNVFFFLNDNSRACSIVASQIKNVDDPYWQKALVYCQTLAGERSKAILGVNLMMEMGETDKVFLGLVNSLLGLDNFKITNLINPTPLHFSMLRAAKIKLTRKFVSTNNPSILKIIALSPNADAELRIDVAERAEALGLIDAKVVQQLYIGTDLKNSEVVTLSPVKTKSEVIERVLLYRKVLEEKVENRKAELLDQIFKSARERGSFLSTVRIYIGIMRGLEATEDLIWFAPEAIRVLLAVGDYEYADNWFNLLHSSDLDDEKIRVLRDEIVPLSRLAGQVTDENWDNIQLDKWWNIESILKKNTPGYSENSNHRALLLYNLFEALGNDVPDRRWDALVSDDKSAIIIETQPALLRMLERAQREKKLAETVLLSLLVLGHSDITQVNPMVIRQIISGFKKVGLHREARNLAIELAVSVGL
ncbi:MAG: hypothetical protein ACJZ9G_08310 [Rhodospirillales bacterium]|tara:strand:- start:43974 stop:45848 length:1875 start_codon:yes stop_codon:yes gene_type:complete